MFNKLRLYFWTIRYLKPGQFWWRIYYFLKTWFARDFGPAPAPPEGEGVGNHYWNHASSPFGEGRGGGKFTFLNITQAFSEKIDWDFAEHGRLWTYNLNYFDFLNRPEISLNDGLSLMENFIENTHPKSVGFEPYPISLRLMNWVKFLERNEFRTPRFEVEIRRQATILTGKIEYQILGNHLLENGFGLFFASHFLCDESFLKQAEKILEREIVEQTRPDGCHFELSPMYHQLMLFRILDCLNLMISNPDFGQNLRPLFEKMAARMLGWLEHFTFRNGQIPMVNDSAPDIAPTTAELLFYGKQLKINSIFNQAAFEPGYRMYRLGKYECFVDAAEIGPDYQPGHAHSDSLNFLLNIGNQPILVDPGVSTYEKNDRRQLERSTRSHNTLMVADCEQSEIWAGFRVGRRARVGIWEERPDELGVALFAFEQLDVRFSRKWKFAEGSILLNELVENPRSLPLETRWHFHPDCPVSKADNRIDGLSFSIHFDSSIKLSIEKYQFADGWNQLCEATVLVARFEKSNDVLIEIRL